MRTSIASAVVLLLAAAPCVAQPRPVRGYVAFNAGSQPASSTFSDHFTFDQNAETATVDVRYPVKGSVLFDGGGGIRLWRQFGAGVAVSRTTHDNTASIDASSPHPFFLNQPRAVTGNVTAVTRTDTAAHVQILYMLPPSGHLRVTLAAGPSLVNLEQKLVTAIHVTDQYPFDTATLGSADTALRRKSAVGFNAGADVAWMFTRRVGAGALVRYTRATVKLTTSDDRSISLDAGGAQAGAGLRVFF